VIFPAILREVVLVLEDLRSVKISKHSLDASTILIISNSASIISLPNSVIQRLIYH